MAIGEVGEFSSLALGNNPGDPSDRARLFYGGVKHLKTDGSLTLDQDNTGDTSLMLGLTFGASRSEGIASKRTPGGNQNGLDFYTASTARLSISNAGNVGIGTTAQPTEKLEVVGTVKATAFVQTDGSSLNSKVNKAGDTITGALTIQNALIVTGNVGVGTTETLGAGLEINKGSTNDLALQLNSSGLGWGSGVRFKNTAANAKTYGIYSGKDGKWHFADVDNSVDRLLVDSAGNVGIGVAQANGKLEVAGELRIRNYSVPTADREYLKLYADGTKSYIQSFGDEEGLWLKSEKEKVHVDGNLRVTANLQVGSDLQASTVQVSSGFKFPNGTVQTTAVRLAAGRVSFGQQTGVVTARQTVNLSGFSQPPTIVVALATVDAAREANLRISASVDKVTSTSFDICLYSWADTTIWSSQVSWIAFGA